MRQPAANQDPERSDAMTTTTQKPFDHTPRNTTLKDAAVVAVTALLVAGFLAHVWRPEKRAPQAVQPAAYLAVR
jgi:hypothetical protein